MHEKMGACISLQSSNFDWDTIDSRAIDLGYDRSKYTQRLYELDIKYNILSNNQLLHIIKNSGKKKLKFFEIIILLFLFVILSCTLTLMWLLL